MKTIVLFALVALFVGFSSAELGVDISYYQGALSQSTFQCFKQNGYDFLIIQAWIENEANTNFATAYQNAQAAGITHIDAYAFICNECHSGQGSDASTIVSALKSNIPSGFSGRIFLDIEQCDGCWNSNGTKNFEFVEEVAEKIKDAGYHLGIYSSASAWTELFGSDASKTTFSSLPLWYAHYDNDAAFSDYASSTFGGWKSPEIKQYQGNANLCGTQVDLDFAGTSSNSTKNATNSTHSSSPKNESDSKPKNSSSPSKPSSGGSSPSKGGDSKPKNSTKPSKPSNKKPSSGKGGSGKGGKGNKGGKGEKGEHSGEHSQNGEQSQGNNEQSQNGEQSQGNNGENSFGGSNGENSFGGSSMGNSFENSNNGGSSFGGNGESSFGGSQGGSSFGSQGGSSFGGNGESSFGGSQGGSSFGSGSQGSSYGSQGSSQGSSYGSQGSSYGSQGSSYGSGSSGYSSGGSSGYSDDSSSGSYSSGSGEY